jgi:hypothetical protein
MGDDGKIHRSEEPDVDLERRLGIRNALLALWNPNDQPVAVSWDDSSIVTADDPTRSRLAQVHSVVHSMLCGQHADAMYRLATMTSLMASFTALRSLTLASELLWNVPVQTWQHVLADARSQVLAAIADDTTETVVGVNAIAEAIRRNLDGDDRQTILDCVARTAGTLSPFGRRGLGSFGAAVLVAALTTTSNGSLGELKEEHAALLVAMARASVITHRDGRLVVEE